MKYKISKIRSFSFLFSVSHKGEIYEINNEMLSKLDILEDYPELYDRQIEEIVTKNG